MKYTLYRTNEWIDYSDPEIELLLKKLAKARNLIHRHVSKGSRAIDEKSHNEEYIKLLKEANNLEEQIRQLRLKRGKA